MIASVGSIAKNGCGGAGVKGRFDGEWGGSLDSVGGKQPAGIRLPCSQRRPCNRERFACRRLAQSRRCACVQRSSSRSSKRTELTSKLVSGVVQADGLIGIVRGRESSYKEPTS